MLLNHVHRSLGTTWSRRFWIIALLVILEIIKAMPDLHDGNRRCLTHNLCVRGKYSDLYRSAQGSALCFLWQNHVCKRHSLILVQGPSRSIAIFQGIAPLIKCYELSIMQRFMGPIMRFWSPYNFSGPKPKAMLSILLPLTCILLTTIPRLIY